jgi:hypothetical protein
MAHAGSTAPGVVLPKSLYTVKRGGSSSPVLGPGRSGCGVQAHICVTVNVFLHSALVWVVFGPHSQED